MPTIITHPAPVLALGAGLGTGVIPKRLLLAALFCAILPDFDVIGFRFGVAYADLLGHRGLSHSLVFALCIGVLGCMLAPWLRARRLTAFAVCFFAVASHIALDAMTSGGLGVAALYPFSEERFFLPWRPIRVSPFSPKAFLTARGVAVITSEVVWVWLPAALLAFFIRLARSTAQGGEERGRLRANK